MASLIKDVCEEKVKSPSKRGPYRKVGRILNKLIDEPLKNELEPERHMEHSYINDYPTKCFLKKYDPVVIIDCALRDLTVLFSKYQNYGEKMFYKAGKDPKFASIEKQAAALRV